MKSTMPELAPGDKYVGFSTRHMPLSVKRKLRVIAIEKGEGVTLEAVVLEALGLGIEMLMEEE